jgi:hypothetical protein
MKSKKIKNDHYIEDLPGETNEDYDIEINLPILPSLKKTKFKKEKIKKFKLDGDTKRVDLHNKNSTKSRINNRR